MTLETFYGLPESERSEWVAKWEVEQDTCTFHHGPRSECPDDEKNWFPQRHICFVEMQLRGAQGLYELLHRDAPYHDGSFKEWTKERSRSHPFRYDDGVTIWMSETELSADDDFLGNAPTAE